MAGQAVIDQGRLLETVGIEIEALVRDAHPGRRALPVPTCPGWTVTDTLRHLGSVYRATRSWLVDAPSAAERNSAPTDEQSVVDELRAGFGELHAELSDRAPEEHARTWWPADATCGFWRRRMAHETTIHRVDVQTACAVRVSAVADDIAVDGIDEILTLWLGRRLSLMGLAGTRECVVAVRAGGCHWLVTVSPDRVSARRCTSAEAAGAHVTVSGTPERVYTWLWGRAAPGTVAVDGPDEDAAGQLWALLRLATR